MILEKRDFPAKKLAACFSPALSLPMFADDKGESEEKKVTEGHSSTRRLTKDPAKAHT